MAGISFYSVIAAMYITSKKNYLESRLFHLPCRNVKPNFARSSPLFCFAASSKSIAAISLRPFIHAASSSRPVSLMRLPALLLPSMMLASCLVSDDENQSRKYSNFVIFSRVKTFSCVAAPSIASYSNSTVLSRIP